MKIGIFDPYLDDIGGGEKYMMTIASCLMTDNDIVVFWDSPQTLKQIASRFSLDLSKVRIAPNIFSKKVGLRKRLVESRKYDIIFFLSDGSLPFVFSKKLFVHIQQPLQHMNVNSIKTKLKLQRVNALFCNSEFTKSFIEKKTNKKIDVIYPPVKLEPKNIQKENIILHVGRFRIKNGEQEDYKKQGVLIEQFKKMAEEGLTQWVFILAVSVQVKDNEAFTKLKTKALGFPIEFIVNTKNDELWTLYSQSKIYWHASGYGENLISHPEYAEHFGISTVEAMGAGCVPVVINAGGQREIVIDGENGILWNTVENLREKTLQIINDQKLWERLSKNAIIRAQFFAGNRFCKKIHTLIQQN